MEFLNETVTIPITNGEMILLLSLANVGVIAILSVAVTTINKYIKWR